MDNFQVVAVEFRPIKLRKAQRTTLHVAQCDNCKLFMFARSQEAAIDAAYDHAEWTEAVKAALD